MTGTDRAESESPQAVEREIRITNKYGIHARPAALFVRTAGRFAAEIKVGKGDTEVSGKSIMGLLTLEGHQGALLKLTAWGEDAEEALDALVELIEKNFDEE